jgi:hypothetical protein
VLELPVAQVQLAALPRVVVMHRVPSVEAACEVLAPYRSRVGTLATDCPERVAAVWGAAPLRAPRVCAPGAMQRPPFARLHDGVDVLAALWGEPAPS